MTNSSAAAPLSQPLYGATIGQAVSRFFKKYATFSGRASRSEFWWMHLALGIISTVLSILIGVLGGATGTANADGSVSLGAGAVPFVIIAVLFGLAIIVPTIALTVRRLHDGNFSGWLYLLNLIPSVGSLIVLILCVMPTNPEGQRFDK